MAAPKADYIWFNGELVPWETANVHILTHSLHYGLGVFEGTRTYEQRGGGSAIFRLDDHLRRLERSAHILQLHTPFNRDVLAAATRSVVARNGLKSCYIRHIVFIGAGVMGLNPQNNPVHAAIAAWNWGTYLGDDGLANGIRCKISSFSRPYHNSTMTRAKATANYVNSILAKREAIEQGYDEALLLDTEGFVAEGSGENLFIVRDGVLKTPPVTAILDGITRDTVMRIAKSRGIDVVEARLTRDEVYIADEVFLTGTAAEITPVREVDGRAIGDRRPGPLSKAIQDEYFRLVRGAAKSVDASWLTPIEFTAV